MQKKKSKPVSKKKPAQIKKNLKTLVNSNKPLPEEKFLIVCGEPSGDLLGANLIEELHKTGGKFSFIGIGGSEMIKTGFSSSHDIESLSVIGFTGILTKYFPLRKIAKELVEKAVANNVHYAILIDYPGFNLYLAEKLREKGIKIIFYVSPQIWAWRFKRIFRIRDCVDLMLVLFPFEKKIYDEYNVNSEFVGHPLCSRMKEKVETEKPISIEKKVTTICLMPGSRSGEITRLIDPILESAVLIQKEMQSKNKKVQFILPNINKTKENFILEKLKLKQEETNLKVQYFFDNSAKCLETSDLVILSSGTATLEVAYFEKPMVIIYKMSYISFQIGLRLVTTKHVGLVNILAGEGICKEFLQDAANADNIFPEAMRILNDDTYRKTMISRIKEVKTSLGDGNAGKKASAAILKLIQES
ncbi:MAG: lipid-A-disaccharide synthase [Leptospiraceae bacterium]|nr:lipid-A-disaccharide synthase [Leptospiraceae bacterium]